MLLVALSNQATLNSGQLAPPPALLNSTWMQAVWPSLKERKEPSRETQEQIYHKENEQEASARIEDGNQLTRVLTLPPGQYSHTSQS